jgi:putative flavoprotein involved in K+ transport
LIIAPDLKETLIEVDQFEIDTLKMVDEYIVRVGLPAPPEMVPQLRDGYEQEVITELNLEGAGISTIIWAIGYSFDFSFVKLPVVDAHGYPRQKRGVTEYEGLYFLGMPWLHSRRSGFCLGLETTRLT